MPPLAASAPAGTAPGQAPRPEPAPPRRGRLLVVWGPTGAPGRTTVALGLAAEAADRGIATCLLDADPYGGAVGQHLAVVDDTSGLLAAARSANAGLLDPTRLASVARQVGPGLRVVTGLPRPDRWREVRRQAFVDLLDTARALDPLVVVDAGLGLSREAADPFDGAPHRDDMSMAALEAADDLVVVASADPVGLTRLARSMLELSDVVGRVPELVVVNRMRAGLGWAPRDVVDMVARVAPTAQVVFLPDDRAGADRALVSGRSLLESGDSALRRAVADLADRALPDVVPAGGRGGRGGSARGLRRRQTVSRR